MTLAPVRRAVAVAAFASYFTVADLLLGGAWAAGSAPWDRLRATALVGELAVAVVGLYALLIGESRC